MPFCRPSFFAPLGTFNLEVCRTSMLHNVFFAHNQLPAAGCYLTTWSLAVQMQFWCLFPLFLLIMSPQSPGFR
jgi:peptidoglycan/LPS O-acetylase OafA/YrhL